MDLDSKAFTNSHKQKNLLYLLIFAQLSSFGDFEFLHKSLVEANICNFSNFLILAPLLRYKAPGNFPKVLFDKMDATAENYFHYCKCIHYIWG